MQLEIQITCTCSVWGMQTQVEGMMISQAEESMTKFLNWAKKYCKEQRQVCQTSVARWQLHIVCSVQLLLEACALSLSEAKAAVCFPWHLSFTCCCLACCPFTSTGYSSLCCTCMTILKAVNDMDFASLFLQIRLIPAEACHAFASCCRKACRCCHQDRAGRIPRCP